ncbi:MAG: hypothetical protein E5W09_01460 [Mesorhizobium sp.]|nr:MAG: hypothetical protein E5W09_01460 [Mesorhizobium sp.]
MGIELKPGPFDMGVWFEIGMRLAAEQPEFNGGKRGRGRPSLKHDGKPGINYQRYNYLRNRCREAGDVLGETVTYQAAIERAMDEGAPLFLGEMDLLIASVSRGHSVFKDAVREMRRLQADAFRRECQHLRSRASWLESVKGDVTRMRQLNRMPAGGILGPLHSERLVLQSRLLNPFRSYN